MSSDKTEEEEHENVSRQIIDYYKNYSQNKQLPKYFLGTPLSYMPPIVQQEELEETYTQTLVSSQHEPPKTVSPTSSKKLEWDSGADIGYENVKNLQKSTSLPLILDVHSPKSSTKKLNREIITVISYPGDKQLSSCDSPEIQVVSSSSSSFHKKTATSSTSSSSVDKSCIKSSSSSTLAYLKRRIGSPGAESTPRVPQKEPLITPELTRNIIKQIHLCVTKPTVVQCLDDQKNLTSKSVQTSVLQSEESSPRNQNTIFINHENTDRDSIISQCNSFEYQKSTENKNVPVDINSSMKILEKLLKSKKYDEATKKKYIKKITNKIINTNYSGDSTASSEFFIPKKPPQVSKFAMKNDDIIKPEQNSSSSYQSWKENKTESEQLFEERGQGDQLISFAKKEREQQLDWIKDEISHLTKLKGLLERRTTTTVYMVHGESSSDSCNCPNPRRYVIQTELSSSSSGSDVPSNYKLDEKNYKVKELTAKKEEINIRRQVVGDIEVVSDDKETKIKVKARRINSGSSSSSGKGNTRSKSQKSVSGNKQYSFDVPLSSHSNFSDKVREIVEKFKKIEKYACKCKCNNLPEIQEKKLDMLLPVQRDKEAMSKPETDNCECQTDCTCTKHVQTKPELKDVKTGPDNKSKQLQIGSDGRVNKISCCKDVQTDLRDQRVETCTCNCDEQVQVDSDGRVNKISCCKDVQANVDVRDQLIETCTCNCDEQVQVDGLAKMQKHTTSPELMDEPVTTCRCDCDEAIQVGIQPDDKKICYCFKCIQVNPDLINERVGTCTCECDQQTQTAVETRPSNRVQSTEALKLKCDCNKIIQTMLKSQDQSTGPSSMKSDRSCHVQASSQLQDQSTGTKLKLDENRKIQVGPETLEQATGTKTVKCDCNKNIQIGPYFKDESIDAAKQVVCECHKQVQTGSKMKDQSVGSTFKKCCCTRQVQTGSEMKDQAIGSKFIKCVCCTKHVQTNYFTDKSVGRKFSTGESSKESQVNPQVTDGSTDPRKVCECTKQVQTSPLENMDQANNTPVACCCTRHAQTELLETDKAVNAKSECVCCSTHVQTGLSDKDTKNECICCNKHVQTSLKTNSTCSKSVTIASSESSSSESSDVESVRSCICCKKKNVTSNRLFSLRNQLDQNYPLCSPCYKQNRNNNCADFYTDPCHICTCYTYVQTSTLNEIKRTIDDLSYLDNFCTCTVENKRNCEVCLYCKSKLHKTTKSRKGIAYMVTLEEEFFGEKKKKKKRPKLEEIKIKVPVASRKKHKDRENSIRRKSENDDSNNENGLNEYLNRNRPDFVENAESRRKAVNKSRKNREQTSEQNKLRFLHKIQENQENNPKPIFSYKEMKEINRRNYKKLPEVQRKLNENKNKQLKQANRLIVDTFNRKLRENVLKGKKDLPTDLKVVDM